MAGASAAYTPLPRSSTDSSSLSDEPLPLPLSLLPRRRRRRRFPSPLHLLRRSRRACKPLYLVLGLLVFLVAQVTFNASYTHPAPFTIPPDERVFIAANLVNGDLINGAWGKAVIELVELIGKDRVHVSIYGGPTSALDALSRKLPCASTLISESRSPLNISLITHTALPISGSSKIKRIAYLAAVRNEALKPLSALSTAFSKVLFLNDVHFHARDAARLLWGTNVNEHGRAEYKAACGADFISTWKYYDSFATRDAEGYSLGVPIFPWFSREGNAQSRRDVLAGRDNVRVKSCWGGIVAFDARYFQTPMDEGKEGDVEEKHQHANSTAIATLPLRFRSEVEPFWEASECCLIHADIISLPSFSPFTSSSSSSTSAFSPDTGIYLNPYVRVAYSASTLAHLPLILRLERLFSVPQAIINHFAHMPRFNPRRAELPGTLIPDRLWVPFTTSSKSSQPHASSPTQDSSSSLSSSPAPAPEFGGEDSTWQGSGAHGWSRSLSARARLGNSHGWDYWATRGHYVDTQRVAGRGGYCGTRQLLIWREGGYGGSVDVEGKEGGGQLSTHVDGKVKGNGHGKDSSAVDEDGKNWDTLVDEVPPLEEEGGSFP